MLSFKGNIVGKANYTQKDYYKDILRAKIEEAESYTGEFKESNFFKRSLANAKGTLSAIVDPPLGKDSNFNYSDIERVVFNLDSSMKSRF